MEKDYITITGIKYYFGEEVFSVGKITRCEKDFNNPFDDEAIKVVEKNFGTLGYVANSPRTVAKGTKSAGRIYDKVEDKFFVKVCFITNSEVICEVLKKEGKKQKRYSKKYR